ncbi:MAG: SOS response-associated peptidase [Tessaracoccus sp.]
MCGRFSMTVDDPYLADVFAIDTFDERTPPAAWQLRPTEPIHVVVESATQPGRRLTGARWDLARPGQKQLRKPGAPLINVRSETLTEKFTWATRRRCLVPATGYWEWTGPKGAKQPHFIHNDALLAFAAVCSWWKDVSRPEGDAERWVLTTAILTTAAHADLASIHERMPVMLPHDAWDTWLNPHTDADPLLIDEMVDAGRDMAGRVKHHPVRPFSTTAEGPELIEPIT